MGNITNKGIGMKVNISERCDDCGERNARKVGDFIHENHQCVNAPPGPSNPPRTIHCNEVSFVRHDFNVAFLRQEIEDAWILIQYLRDKRWEAEKAVIQSVKTVMSETYNPVSLSDRLKQKGFEKHGKSAIYP